MRCLPLLCLGFLSYVIGSPFIFQVKNANLTIQLLKRLDYGRMNENWRQSIHSKLGTWETTIVFNPLLFENPVTNFLIQKMLRVDIQEEMIPKHLERGFRSTVNVPKREDLRKSAILINDMMKNYGMPLHKISQPFNFGDCLTMVEELFDEGLVTASELWLKVSEEKYRNEQNDADYINFLDMKNRQEDLKAEFNEKEIHEKLCTKSETAGNHETFQNASTWCRYVQDGKNPLMVRKLEELSQEPIVQIVHDFLSNEEVEELLEKSANYDFDVAPISGISADTYQQARKADSYFIDEKRDSLANLTKKIKMRMQRISGINMDHSEDLEIIKYRPGGVHEPHVDNYETEEEVMRESPDYGNRYANGLLFLTHTELGGNFAMALLGISVVPCPGTMVIWHNVDRNGIMDHRSFHGGCKVFVGHKIVGSTIGLYLDQDKAQSGA
eukprot:GFUD01007584.1.p1 GENE.GFUD01007584.1~~GFUD01007584.1.p1  ORF type:complete len:441 (+),score=100.57 GFUD01007584.1:37-1359(+)